MTALNRSLSQHSHEISDCLSLPSEADEEDLLNVDMLDADILPQRQTSTFELLQGELGTTLRQYAEGLRIPVEACYWVVLCAASSLIPSQTRLVIDPRIGFEVPPILWGGLVGEAGNGEYRLVNTLIRPLKEIHSILEIQYLDWLGKYRAAMRRLKKGATIEDPIERPHRIKLFTNKWTIKAIGRILNQQPGQGLLVDANWMVRFLLGTNIWQSGQGIDHYRWLSLYDGEALDIDCGASGSIFVRYPSVSIVGGIQTYGLREFWKKCVKKNSNLWSCFAWAKIPPVQDPDAERVPYPHPRQLLMATYYRLLKLPSMQHKLDEEGRQLWNEWKRDFDKRIFSEPLDLFQVMLIKTKERAARIALVLHWLEAACSKVTPSKIIPADTLGKGMELALWLQKQIVVRPLDIQVC